MSQDELYLYAVTARVVDELTSGGLMFTALDVSNAVKQTVAEARHREISPIVRDIFERRGMGAYVQTSIDVMAAGNKPLDWGAGENLAFATLLADGARVRYREAVCARDVR